MDSDRRDSAERDATAAAQVVLVRWRALLVSLLLLGLGLALVVYLALAANIDAAMLVRTLVGVEIVPFVLLTGLTALYLLCGAEKWRLVDAVLRHNADAGLSREMTFALTALGMVLGNLFPMQLGTALTRTLGAYVTGHKAIVRGALGTIVEQAFDLLLVGVLAIISLLALSFRAPPAVWIGLALIVVLAAAMLSGATLGTVRRLAVPDRAATRHWPWIGRRIGELDRSGLLEPRLAHRLWALSFVRFGLLVLMAGASAWAMNLEVPILHFAGAMPFAVAATALSPTPAGLGVNELTYAALLHAFGTPLDVATQWAIVNRILVIVASLIVAPIGAVVTFAVGLRRRRLLRDRAGGRSAA